MVEITEQHRALLDRWHTVRVGNSPLGPVDPESFEIAGGVEKNYPIAVVQRGSALNDKAIGADGNNAACRFAG